MKIKHILVGDLDKVLVYCNSETKLKVREFIYKSEMRYRTLGAVFDGVGEVWFPTTLPEYDDKCVFYVQIDNNFEGLDNWDGEHTMIVPSYNFEIFEIDKNFSRENQQRIREWSYHSERWYLDWLKERELEPLKDFQYNKNEIKND